MLVGAFAVGMIAAWQGAAVEVQGQTPCPSAGAVDAELNRIAGPGVGAGDGRVDPPAVLELPGRPGSASGAGGQDGSISRPVITGAPGLLPRPALAVSVA